MLEITFIAADILEVKESSLGFLKTTVRYFYYDVVNWVRYNYRPVSTPMTVELIRSNPTPDKKYHDEQKMTPESIAWVKTHYTPKATRVIKNNSYTIVNNNTE